jgi:hypothetical protein
VFVRRLQESGLTAVPSGMAPTHDCESRWMGELGPAALPGTVSGHAHCRGTVDRPSRNRPPESGPALSHCGVRDRPWLVPGRSKKASYTRANKTRMFIFLNIRDPSPA